MVLHILRKDWTLLWPLVAVFTAIQAGLEWTVWQAGLFGDSSVAAELIHPLTLAWYVGITALTALVVYQDPIPGVDQDWLIRPLRRTELLTAKCSFVAASICIPMLVMNCGHALLLGLPWQTAIAMLAYKEAYVFVCLLVPVIALAACTRNLTELIVLAAAMVVSYAASSGAASLVLGFDRCPTCGTGLSWLQHVMQHVEIVAGACVIVALQYYRRRTVTSRTLCVVGAAIVVFVQLSWNAAFTLQHWVAKDDPLPEFSLGWDEDPLRAGGGPAPYTPATGRQAARALMQGDMGQALDLMRHRAASAEPLAALHLGLRVGLSGAQLLLIDRSEFRLEAPSGTLLYREVDPGESQNSRIWSEGPGAGVRTGDQIVNIPASVLRTGAAQRARLRADYSVTIMQPVAEFTVAADDGDYRSAVVGVCKTKADSNGTSLRCEQIGRAPFCYSATVNGPDGSRNPPVTECEPDYRPYIPAFVNALSFSGVNLPLRDRSGLAHYPVDPSDLSGVYLRVTVYSVRGHTRRTLVTALRD